MKIPTPVASALFALALVAVGAVTVRADVITFAVQANVEDDGGNELCLPGDLDCRLGGEIVINNGTGAIVSEDVTATGFDPGVGPFTINSGISSTPSGLTQLTLADAANDQLLLDLSTPTPGSLIGYTGGSISPLVGAVTNPNHREDCLGVCAWNLDSGSLTAVSVVPAVPEPSSLALMLSALAGLGGLIGWRRRSHRPTPG